MPNYVVRMSGTMQGDDLNDATLRVVLQLLGRLCGKAPLPESHISWAITHTDWVDEVTDERIREVRDNFEMLKSLVESESDERIQDTLTNLDTAIIALEHN